METKQGELALSCIHCCAWTDA